MAAKAIELRFEDLNGFYFEGDVEVSQTEVGAGVFKTEIPDIVDCSKAITVDFNWTTEGLFTPIPGRWKVDVIFEEMGPGEAPASVSGYYAHPHLAIGALPFPFNYDHTTALNVPASHCAAGLYRVLFRLRFEQELPIGFGTYVPTPIVAFGEAGLIEFT
ncbi:MAG: hypothetical protein H6557_10080 [Lewinellaceae bacterium]|nr:hypothetical protein [Phaeodactylibacter sp.]MCB9036956.1 hypothetical protein [Lewinellaceae bacterium]